MICEMYGFAHKTMKKLLKRNNDLPDTVKLVSFPSNKANGGFYNISEDSQINEIETKSLKLYQSDIYPVENLVAIGFDQQYPLSFQYNNVKLRYALSLDEAAAMWPQFISSSVIPEGYRNAGMHYAGYIKECQEWCLPSWIWTNAAIVRYYCSIEQIDTARKLGDLIIAQQQECGGWIVRNDYTCNGVSPQLAPNDSCYIALNCCLSLYDITGEKKYLDSAETNAKWVQSTSRPDGMVWFGYDTKNQEWVKDRNIVDTGFTAGLFARLYEITGKTEYFEFLEKFVSAYIKAFYMPNKKCFSTAIDGNDRQHGGAFGRGQGWALEGLLPAYRVLKNEDIKKVIDETVETILSHQQKNGAWAYNLLKPLMGDDCKAVPIIAKCLLDWFELGNQDLRLIVAAQKGLEWCAKHTAINADAMGGIFSYTIEGAIVHHMYTNTALVYGSSYALEVMNNLTRLS